MISAENFIQKFALSVPSTLEQHLCIAGGYALKIHTEADYQTDIDLYVNCRLDELAFVNIGQEINIFGVIFHPKNNLEKYPVSNNLDVLVVNNPALNVDIIFIGDKLHDDFPTKVLEQFDLDIVKVAVINLHDKNYKNNLLVHSDFKIKNCSVNYERNGWFGTNRASTEKRIKKYQQRFPEFTLNRG